MNGPTNWLMNTGQDSHDFHKAPNYIITYTDGSMKKKEREDRKEWIGYHTGRGGKEKWERRNGKTRRSIRRRNDSPIERIGNSNRVPVIDAEREQETIKNRTICRREQHTLACFDNKRETRIEPTEITRFKSCDCYLYGPITSAVVRVCFGSVILSSSKSCPLSSPASIRSERCALCCHCVNSPASWL